MKHGRFLATISSSILLASPLCAAQDPTIGSQMDVLAYFVSLFDELNEVEIKEIGAKVDRTITINNYCESKSGYSVMTEYMYKGKSLVESAKETYETVYDSLSGKYFLEVDGRYKLIESNKYLETIDELAEYLLNRCIAGYEGASDHWRNCYFFVMCKILSKGI